VVSQVQLGPLEATTLAGGDLAGVRDWLHTHHYDMRPEVVGQLDAYLRQGWAFVAMRLTASGPLNGRLAPVMLRFDSDRLVYPMGMSAAATTPQRVVVYTLGAHRMQRTDADTATQAVTVDYAGRIAGRSHDPTVTELAARGPYLTRMAVNIDRPSAITSDFVFDQAPSGDPYQRVVHRDEAVDITPFALGAGAVLAVLAVDVVLIIRNGRVRGAASPSAAGPPATPAS